jgi:hypothetical protein
VAKGAGADPQPGSPDYVSAVIQDLTTINSTKDGKERMDRLDSSGKQVTTQRRRRTRTRYLATVRLPIFRRGRRRQGRGDRQQGHRGVLWADPDRRLNRAALLPLKRTDCR